MLSQSPMKNNAANLKKYFLQDENEEDEEIPKEEEKHTDSLQELAAATEAASSVENEQPKTPPKKISKKRKNEILELGLESHMYNNGFNAFRPKSGPRQRKKPVSAQDQICATENKEREFFLENFKKEARRVPPSQVAFKDEEPIMGDYDDFAELDEDNSVVKQRGDKMQKSVFAKRALKKFDIVALYGGVIIEADDAEEGDYTIELSKSSKWAIKNEPGDSEELLFMGPYVNDCKGVGDYMGYRAYANAEYVFYGKFVGGEAKIMPVVRTLRDIQKGEEIFCEYGTKYWRSTPEFRAYSESIPVEWVKPAHQRNYLREMRWDEDTDTLSIKGTPPLVNNPIPMNMDSIIAFTQQFIQQQQKH